MKNIFITLRLPEDLSRRIREKAKETDRSMGAIVRLAIASYLEKEDKHHWNRSDRNHDHMF